MSAYGRAGQRAHCGANRGAFHAAVDGRFVRIRAPDLAERELPAIGIVGAKLVETLAGTGHRHDAWPNRNGSARAEHQ
jgi:hypothetical protein